MNAVLVLVVDRDPGASATGSRLRCGVGRVATAGSAPSASVNATIGRIAADATTCTVFAGEGDGFGPAVNATFIPNR